MTTIHFAAPHNLGQYARDIRDGLCDHGYNYKHCCVGWHDNVVKLADDNGCIEYTFQPDGRITRRHYDHPCKLIELTDIDVARYVKLHNEALKEAAA